MRRLPVFRLILIAGVLLVLGAALAGVGAQPANDVLQARWIHAQLNAWRLGLELGPLAANDTLAQMAFDQAAYLAGMTSLPRTQFIHNGRQGEGPRVRALWPEYGWPDFGITGQIVLSEITWVGERQDALDFWHESRVHRESATNPWYREVGVAAVPYRRNRITGYIFVAVLGSRPNVLPALADPQGGSLYLTNETFNGGRGERMRSAQQVRLFDGDGRPLTNGWIPWAAKLQIPEGAGSAISVLYSDGTTQTLGRASTMPGDIPLPGYEGAWRAQPATFGLAVPTAAPTLTPTPPPPPRLRLVYDRYGLSIMNVSVTPADIRALRLVGDGRELPATELTIGFLRGSLRAMPINNCLIFGLNSPRLDRPNDCRYSSVTYARTIDLFWTRGDFSVFRGDAVIERCAMDAGVCEFDWP